MGLCSWEKTKAVRAGALTSATGAQLSSTRSPACQGSGEQTTALNCPEPATDWGSQRQERSRHRVNVHPLPSQVPSDGRSRPAGAVRTDLFHILCSGTQQSTLGFGFQTTQAPRSPNTGYTAGLDAHGPPVSCATLGGSLLLWASLSSLERQNASLHLASQ